MVEGSRDGPSNEDLGMPGFPAGAVVWLPAGECSFLTEAAARLPTVKHGLLSGAAACFPGG